MNKLKSKPEKDSKENGSQSWMVYILRCSDGTLYTGITNRLSRRLIQHQEGRAARYTRGRRPVHLVYGEPALDRSEALKKESAVKALSRLEKEELIDQGAKGGG